MSDFNGELGFGRRTVSATAAPPKARPERRGFGPWSIPIWPVFALILIAVVVIQRFPVPGVMLMMMAAPLWPVVLVNLLLLAFALDAIRGAMPRWLLVVPALVYGVNLIASGASAVAYLSLRHEIATANAQAAIAYDPARMAIVGRQSEALVQRYALPVAYGPARYGGYSGQLAWRVLPKAVCDTLPAPSMMSAVSRTFVTVGKASVANACLFHSPEKPAVPVLRLETSTEEIDGLVKGRIFRTTLTPPGGAPRTLRRARVGILPPIPMVVSGCALNSGQLAWQCQTGLMRWPVRIAADETWDESALLARALGLKPRITRPLPPENRHPRLAFDEAQTASLARTSMQALQQARAVAADDTRRQLALLDRLLAGDSNVAGIDHRNLMANADLMASRAEAIMRRIEALDGDGHDHDAARKRMLMELAASLPPEAFEPIGHRLFRQVVDSEAPIKSDLVLVRLGDVGSAAWPYLRSRASEPGFKGMAALTALCRAGDPSLAQAVAGVEMTERDGRFLFARQEVKVVALARMGRSDLARPIVAAMTGPRQAWARAQLATITPASPPSSCRPQRSRLYLPRTAWLEG